MFRYVAKFGRRPSLIAAFLLLLAMAGNVADYVIGLLVHTQALASHYSFSPQGTLDATDVLGRYRAYAIENVCPRKFVEPVW